MSDPLPNPHQLLERWIRGELDHKEEARLFAAASEDPFLADALEGYLKVPEAAHAREMAALRKAEGKEAAKKKSFLLWRNPRLLGIAASVALLIAAGLWWTLGRNNLAAPLAEETMDIDMEMDVPELAAAPSADRATSGAAPDQAPLAANPTIQASPVPELRSAPSVLNEAPSIGASAASDAVQRAPEPSGVVTEELANSEPDAKEKESVSAEMVHNKFLIQGQVVDTEGNPVPGLALMANGTRERAGTGRDGRFTFAVESLDQDLVVLSDLYEPVQVPVNDDDAIKIVVQRKPSEMAHAQMNESKDSQAGSKALSKKKMRSATAPASKAVPLSAWDQYLLKEKKNPGTAKGAVLLSFMVDSKGRPADIRVDQSLGNIYDVYCKNLLLNGPDWDAGNGSRRQVRIDF